MNEQISCENQIGGREGDFLCDIYRIRMRRSGRKPNTPVGLGRVETECTNGLWSPESDPVAKETQGPYDGRKGSNSGRIRSQ